MNPLAGPLAATLILAGGLALLWWRQLGRADRAHSDATAARIQRDHAQQRLTSLRAELALTRELCGRAQARAAVVEQTLREVTAAAALSPDSLDGYPADEITPVDLADVWRQLTQLDHSLPIEWRQQP